MDLQKDVTVGGKKALFGASTKEYAYQILKGRFDLASGKVIDENEGYTFVCSVKGGSAQ